MAAARTAEVETRLAQLDPSLPSEERRRLRWTCFRFSDRYRDGTTAHHGLCKRTHELCAIHKAEMSGPSRTPTGCTQQREAYCMLVKQSRAETVSYVCAPTMELCQANRRSFDESGHYEILDECTLRE